MAILTIHGTIDLSQFWPTGGSDADTTKIIVTVNRKSFIYQRADGTKRTTKVFLTAQYDDRGTLKPLLRKGNTVIVRLQGIDAPELHYRPTAVKGKRLAGTGLVKDYRQHQAETATVRAANFLKKYGTGSVKCRFVTALQDDKGPGEAVDKYGRFVGNIVMSDGTDVNLWILRNGLAVAGLYNSMLDREIADCIRASAKAKSARSSIARFFKRKISAFDSTLLYRRPTKSQTPNVLAEGKTTFIFPKLFRRQVNWWANSKAGNVAGGFAKFLKEHSADDYVFDTDDFLSAGALSATPRRFAELIQGNALTAAPEDIVFKEAPSHIYKPGAAKKELRQWDF
jgi:endonuclease YncB( thermonuclease family)